MSGWTFLARLARGRDGQLRAQPTRAAAFALACLCLWPAMVSAQGKLPWEEHSRLIEQGREVAPLEAGRLFGESVDLYSGGLSFSATDVAIPGNSSLPVAVTRKLDIHNRDKYGSGGRGHAFADWDIDIPNVSGVFATQWHDNRCSQAVPPIVASRIPADEYWSGNHASLPGGGEMLRADIARPKPTTGGPHVWLTAGDTYFSCLATIRNGTGQGFLAIDKDGTRYWLDHMAQYVEPDYTHVDNQANPKKLTVQRRKNVLYATRIEDRFGNWVTYAYGNTSNQPVRLTTITASDGRSLSLQYNANGHVQSVSDGARSWTYNYTGNSLSQVVLPDNSHWAMNLASLSAAVVKLANDPNEMRSCFSEDFVLTGNASGTITHPSGAMATFVVGPQQIGRTNVPGICRNYAVPGTPGNDTRDDFPIFPVQWTSLVIRSKQIQGPGLSPMLWTYAIAGGAGWQYPPGQSHPLCQTTTCAEPVCLSDACAGRRTVTITGPGSDWERYTFGNSYRYNEGKLLSHERGSGPGAVLRTVAHQYDLAIAGQPYAARVGTSPQPRGAGFTSEYPRPQVRTETAQDGVLLRWEVDKGCAGPGVYCLDTLLRPTRVLRTGNANRSRTESITYHDRVDRWVVGQIASTTCVSSVPATEVCNGDDVISATDYDANALPWRSFAFGKLLQAITYHADGTVASVSDARDAADFDTTIHASDWKRGIPQLIQSPATASHPAASQLAVVDDHGRIRAIVNEAGARTCYDYDPMGRISRITYPSATQPHLCDESRWSATLIAFTGGHGAVHGLPAQHWRQVVSTGNARREVFLDALWRPVLEQSYDHGNRAATLSQSVKRYDTAGRLAFQSNPLRNAALDIHATLPGVRTEYDALGRPTASRQDSEHGVLSTTTEYLTGFVTRVTSPKHQGTGIHTDTHYLTWDTPTTDFPVTIFQPEDAQTHIFRDAFGKPTGIIRRNGSGSQQVARHFVYDSHQQLCKTIEPETHATVFGYDAAGNLAWSAAGLGLPDGNDCNTAQGLAAASRVNRTYDARNRLATLAFPDTRGNQAWSYFPDGKVHQVRTTNVPGTQDAFNTYAWDARGNLVTETLAVPAWYTYSIGYGYDANNSLARVTYPSGRNVDYHPNALGQPQRVIDAAPGSTAYAHAMSWHPNGTLAGYTYGNGIAFTMSPNARGLPHHVKHGAVVENFHDYDANGNVSAILDLVRGAAGHRWMDYDGLDRLSHMGSATLAAIPGSNHHVHYTYDALDNLETQKMPSTSGGHVRDWRYCYNGSNQLAFIRSGSTSCNDGAATVALGYDGQGNVGWHNEKLFDFDEGNRLREIYSENPYTILERYRYDAHGRRILAMRASEGTVLYQYAMDGKLMYQNSSRPAQNHAIDHIYLAGSLLAQREVSHATGVATVKYQHTDALGSPVAVTDAAGGLIERLDHEPYGKALGSPANTGNDRPGYTGHVEDRATGLTYIQQRYYDPMLGVFLSVDPVTAYGGDYRHLNRYAYAYSNPYKFTDPDGRSGKLIRLVRNIAKADGNPIKGAADTLSGIVDDVGTLADGQLNVDDAVAVVSLVTGFDKKDQKAIGGVAAKVQSAIKRRAARQAQRNANVPTSRSGRNVQGNGPDQPRHQIKEGKDGEPVGVVDGSRDRNNGDDHPPGMEAGPLKEDGLNRYGTPRISNDKGRANFRDHE